MKSISIKNIKKTFYSLRRGKISALKGVDIEIEAGKFFVLLGPSGCGKSTLLNIIAGIEKPTGGEIKFDDKIVVSTEQKKFLSPKERDIAMVFQSYALYPHMTAFENIAFPLKIAKMNKGEIKNKVEKAAEILEIKNILEAKPGEMSGGQRQRVALGRAIVRQPNVLLLDEPLSNLDAMLRISMRSELKQIQRDLNLTTVYVTHDQIEAMSLGDKIAVLKEGEVQQLGTPDEIYNKPVNLFVAKFIGTPPMNVLDIGIINHFKKDYRKELKNKENILFGIRPEEIKLINPGEGVFDAKLNMIGSLGGEAIVYLSIDNNEILAKIPGKINFKEKDIAGIDFKEESLYIFNKNNEQRIE